jgi:hypothetical protein
MTTVKTMINNNGESLSYISVYWIIVIHFIHKHFPSPVIFACLSSDNNLGEYAQFPGPHVHLKKQVE